MWRTNPENENAKKHVTLKKAMYRHLGAEALASVFFLDKVSNTKYSDQ